VEHLEKVEVGRRSAMRYSRHPVNLFSKIRTFAPVRRSGR
jgi:hypothetical protein